jgi:hypothetical protein
LAQYQNFLLLIGSVFAPLFGVVLVDHFILRKRSGQVAAAALRWPALLAWLGGISTYHLLANCIRISARPCRRWCWQGCCNSCWAGPSVTGNSSGLMMPFRRG